MNDNIPSIVGYRSPLDVIFLRLEENGLTYSDASGIHTISYGDITKIEHSSSVRTTGIGGTFMPAISDRLVFMFQKDNPIYVNPVSVNKNKTVRFVNTLLTKNPNIELDKDTLSLKNNDYSPFEKSTKLGILSILLIGLLTIAISIFIPTPGHEAPFSLQHIDLSTILFLGSTIIFFVLIVVVLLRTNKK